MWDHHVTVLQDELRSAEYNGISVDQAYARLVEDRQHYDERLGSITFVSQSRYDAWQDPAYQKSRPPHLVVVDDTIVSQFQRAGIPGFPNIIHRDLFTAIWQVVRGS